MKWCTILQQLFCDKNFVGLSIDLVVVGQCKSHELQLIVTLATSCTDKLF